MGGRHIAKSVHGRIVGFDHGNRSGRGQGRTAIAIGQNKVNRTGASGWIIGIRVFVGNGMHQCLNGFWGGDIAVKGDHQICTTATTRY